MNRIVNAIVTPTWNNDDFTIRCFDSIQKNTSDYIIIWVDNGSEKKSVEKVQHFLDSNKVPYELILNSENLGFVKATNQGMKRAIEVGARYVILQNNDTEVYSGWVEGLIDVAESNPKIGLVGPITSPCASWQSVDNLRKSMWEFFSLPAYNNNPQNYSQIVKRKFYGQSVDISEYLAFFCVLIKSDVIKDIGILSEDYGVGFGDDNDYCMRALSAGWKLKIASQVFVFHNHRTTFKAIYAEDDKIIDMQKNNWKIFKKKNRNAVLKRSPIVFVEKIVKKINSLLISIFSYIKK